MQNLTTLQGIALSLLDRVGNKTVLRIGEVLNEKQISISTPNDMFDFLVMARERKLVSRLPEFTSDDVAQKYMIAQRIINESEAAGIHAVSYLDSDYPKQLLKTVDEKGNPAAPIILYYKGDINIASQPGLAVIGTREPTSEGERIGEFLASEFAKQGFNIVSGLAVGCDTCAHRGALKVNGKTTAFLAHGLTSIYPPQNESLAKEIIEKGGLLMSEYPIGTSLSPYNLVARDRLQSGMSKATLVIQTGRSGGTMHAVNSTLAAQKPLYVIKYQDAFTMDHEKTQGNVYLAQRPNGAKYISETDNIIAIACELKNSKPVQTSLFD